MCQLLARDTQNYASVHWCFDVRGLLVYSELCCKTKEYSYSKIFQNNIMLIYGRYILKWILWNRMGAHGEDWPGSRSDGFCEHMNKFILACLACVRTQSLRKMWPVHLTFLYFTVYMLVLFSWAPRNTSFFTQLDQTFRSVHVSTPYKTMLQM